MAGLWRRCARADLISAAAGLMAFLFAWLVLGPARLGGSATYLMVRGTSMLPAFRTGDLVVVREAARYRAGEVVAYENRQLHEVVLHRIVAVEGGRYVLKGDNNSFEDAYRPARAELIGRLWLRVAGAGRLLRAMREPRNAALLTGVVAMATVAGEANRRARRRRRRALGLGGGAAGPGASVAAMPGGVDAAVVAAGLALLLLFGALCLVAFRSPTTRLAATTLPYRQTGVFTYAGPAPSGPVYPDGSVETGEPVFLKLVPAFSVRFAYRFDSALPHAVRGTEELLAVVAGESGWRHTFVLQPVTPFQGDRFAVQGMIDLGVVEHMIARVLASTGLQGDRFTLSVTPRVQVDGAVGGRSFRDAWAPALRFSLAGPELRPELGRQPGLDPLRPARAGGVAVRRPVPNRFSFLRFRLTVAVARQASLAGLGLGLLALGFGAARLRAQRRRSEADRIRARYGAMMIDARDLGLEEGGRVVRVTDMESLARLAVQYERLILHQWKGGVDDYVVHVAECTYCYRAGAPTPGSGRPEPAGAKAGPA
jgi:signal peptidase I